MMSTNPCHRFTFYDKDNQDKAIELEKHEISEMLPDKFAVKLCYSLIICLYVDIQCFAEERKHGILHLHQPFVNKVGQR